jgi:hypothetical protein
MPAMNLQNFNSCQQDYPLNPLAHCATGAGTSLPALAA